MILISLGSTYEWVGFYVLQKRQMFNFSIIETEYKNLQIETEGFHMIKILIHKKTGTVKNN